VECRHADDLDLGWTGLPEGEVIDMPTTDYIVANGMMLGEVTNGVMRNYGTDALGSVVQTYSNGVPENTYAYKPYGATLTKTGTAVDPSFLWNGRSGYRATTLTNSNYYVRRRHFSSTSAIWSSVDLIWPLERAYVYAADTPTTKNDPTGLAGISIPPPTNGSPCNCNTSNTTYITKTSFNKTIYKLFPIIISISYSAELTTIDKVNSDCSETYSYISSEELHIGGLTGDGLTLVCTALSLLITGNPLIAGFAGLACGKASEMLQNLPCMRSTGNSFGTVLYDYTVSNYLSLTIQYGPCGRFISCNENSTDTCGNTTKTYSGPCTLLTV
jgi:RHS repeat-associated protein